MADPLKVQETKLTEKNGKRVVEIVLADNSDAEKVVESVVIRVLVPAQYKYPTLPEARSEALDRVRLLVDAEIEATEHEFRIRHR